MAAALAALPGAVAAALPPLDAPDKRAARTATAALECAARAAAFGAPLQAISKPITAFMSSAHVQSGAGKKLRALCVRALAAVGSTPAGKSAGGKPPAKKAKVGK